MAYTKSSHFQLQFKKDNNDIILNQARYILEPYIIRIFPNENLTTISAIIDTEKGKRIESVLKLPYRLDIDVSNVQSTISKIDALGIFK